MAAEGELDESVWIVKTHYPERRGRMDFYCNKVIVVVRNPMDCITSLFHMTGTVTHNQSLKPAVIDKIMKETTLWEDFVRTESRVWATFHTYWLERAKKMPVFFLKYEDLLTNPQESLSYLMEFLLNRDTISELPISERIDQLCTTGNVGMNI